MSWVNHVSTDEKRILAEKVVDLTVMNRARAIASDSNGRNAEKTEKLMSQMRGQQIDLYIKHYHPAQLKALIDFYDTDMGKSILVTQKHVSEDMAFGIVTKDVGESSR